MVKSGRGGIGGGNILLRGDRQNIGSREVCGVLSMRFVTIALFSLCSWCALQSTTIIYDYDLYMIEKSLLVFAALFFKSTK